MLTGVKTLTIATYYDPPPIPYRNQDWCAYEEGYEEDENCGWGATEREAINNFLDILEEDERL